MIRDVIYANRLRKARLTNALDILNKVLEKRRFLLGDLCTLADICVAIDLMPLFEVNAGTSWPAARVSNNLNLQTV